MAGKGRGHDPHDDAIPDGYGDSVTIVLSRRCAEDLYYALVMALGGSPPFGDPAWAPGKGKGKGKGKPPGGRPKAEPKPKA